MSVKTLHINSRTGCVEFGFVLMYLVYSEYENSIEIATYGSCWDIRGSSLQEGLRLGGGCRRGGCAGEGVVLDVGCCRGEGVVLERVFLV